MKQILTRDEVFEAANNLAADGIMPTNVKIRNAVGGRGSENTINNFLGEWKRLLLQKNDSGCLFCESLQQETLALRERLSSQIAIIQQLKEAVTVMLQTSRDHIVAEEVIRILQNDASTA